MSLKRKIISIITLTVAVVAFSTFAAAQDETTGQTDGPKVKERRGEGRERGFAEGRKGHRMGMRGGRGMMRGLRGIELTEDQRMQIKSMMEAHRAGNQQQREEMRALFMKKRDGSITGAESVRLDQLKNDMRASAEQLKNSVLALLTPEQNQKLEQLRVEREQRMQERRQRREENRKKPTN